MVNLKIKGHIWIETNQGHLIGPGRKKLLEAIRDCGSITLAAKSMKMSYRHAWEMINEMNTISNLPLVEKNTGGINGGGSTLTPEGEKLIAEYNKLNLAFENFKSQENKSI
jgi:molybdate transport system regulatory protein